ncbi:PREDICTED: Kv channel-interacting protein 1-like [Atta cephalotes]|uniref:EF-hand domain-containing protein n=1 Tax=Atta cephalotes TaxID=12957 RepID=A0A158NAV4_ATTCE|nr:PREDICTED: Kv channel-interacting protein 1-like [Atta cephalotes]
MDERVIGVSPAHIFKPQKDIALLECPEGVVHEDSFKDIYAKFFPHGNSSLYAHYVFKAFDVNCNGAISFRDLLVTLSTLLRGSIYEKLRWTFKLYDINGDGCITRGELGEVVTAVHELMGRRHHAEEERKAREQLDRVFKKLDLNQDGVITIEEFIESCLKPPAAVTATPPTPLSTTTFSQSLSPSPPPPSYSLLPPIPPPLPSQPPPGYTVQDQELYLLLAAHWWNQPEAPLFC